MAFSSKLRDWQKFDFNRVVWWKKTFFFFLLSIRSRVIISDLPGELKN